MLRVAANGLSADDVRSIAGRLRGALLECCEAPASEDPVWQAADAIVFVPADGAQSDLMETTLSAGKHVLALARAGLPIETLDRLSEIARERRVLLAVENPDHALPSRRLIRQQIDNARLGDVGLVRIHRCEAPPPGGTQPSRGVPAALIGDLETALWLVGRGPNTVYAVRRAVARPSAPHGDFLHVHLGFPFGGMAIVTLSTALPPGDAHQSLSVIASTGAAYADEHQNRQLLFGGGLATAPLADEGEALPALVQEFVSAVPHSDGAGDRLQSWRRLARVVTAAEESLATRQAVELELD